MTQRLTMAFLTPFFPYPLDHGGAVRIFNLLRHLADECEITLLALADSFPAPDALEALWPYCRDIQVFLRTNKRHAIHRAWPRQQSF